MRNGENDMRRLELDNITKLVDVVVEWTLFKCWDVVVCGGVWWCVYYYVLFPYFCFFMCVLFSFCFCFFFCFFVFFPVFFLLRFFWTRFWFCLIFGLEAKQWRRKISYSDGTVKTVSVGKDVSVAESIVPSTTNIFLSLVQKGIHNTCIKV